MTGHRSKKRFLFSYESLKNVFYVFKNIFYVFFGFLIMRFFVIVKTKTYKITNMMHFSWAKTPFRGQSECFVAVLLTLFDSY